MQLLWASSLALVKISILIFYSRIFAVRGFIIAAKMTAVFVLLWGISVFLTVFFICRPFAYNWDSSIPGGTCGNSILSYTVLGALNLTTDLMVIALPMPYIWSLDLRTPSKIGLTCTFMVGIGASIFSILRIASLTTVSESDFLFDIPQPLMWGELEPALGITLACVPLLRPLFIRDRTLKGSSRSGSRTLGDHNRMDSRNLKQIDDQEYPLRSLDANDVLHQNTDSAYNGGTDAEIYEPHAVTKDEAPAYVQVTKDWSGRYH